MHSWQVSPRYWKLSLLISCVDCTGSSQVGLKLLSRAVPSLPTDLREVYDPDTAYTTLEFPLPPNFDDDLRALKIPYLSGHALYDTDSCHNYFVYNPDPKDDSRFLAVMRRDTDGGDSQTVRRSHVSVLI